MRVPADVYLGEVGGGGGERGVARWGGRATGGVDCVVSTTFKADDDVVEGATVGCMVIYILYCLIWGRGWGEIMGFWY